MLKFTLVENLLTARNNDYMAQTVQVRSFSTEEITELMLNRGSLLTKADILAVLEVYYQEIANIIADGNGINTKAYHIAPSISGVFEGMNDGFDSSRHQIRLNLRAGSLLHEATKKIRVEKTIGISTMPLITEVYDIKSNTSNELLTPGFNLRITGNRLKVAGESEMIGVYFTNLTTHERIAVELSDMVINNPSELIIIIPSLDAGSYHLEVVTQYSSGGSTFLKNPRTGIFDKELTVN